MFRLRSGLAVGAAVVSVALTGCGTASNSGQNVGAEGETSPAVDVTDANATPTNEPGEPLKVIAVASGDNVAAAAHPEFWEGAEAAAAAVNADGGVNGRPIEIVRCNDEGLRTARQPAVVKPFRKV